jgi:hypothetical protein
MPYYAPIPDLFDLIADKLSLREEWDDCDNGSSLTGCAVYALAIAAKIADEKGGSAKSRGARKKSDGSVDDKSKRAKREADDDLVRVGRWMSKTEYDAMVKTGMVQEGAGGTTYVASPADPEAYRRQAAPGTGYVEFDVPEDSLYPAGEPGWAQIPGPNSMHARLAVRRKMAIPEFPRASNIEWLMEK